jgi:hypothetical protein
MNRAACLFLFATIAMGCTSETSDAQSSVCVDVPDAQRESCLTDHYLGHPEPSPFAACDGSPKLQAPPFGRLELTFFFGLGETDAAAVDEGRRAASFFAPYGISFYTRHPAASSLARYAIDGSTDDMTRRAEAAGIPLQGSLTSAQTEQLRRIIGEVLFANTRDFIVGRTTDAAHGVSVLVLSQIVSPDLNSQLKTTLGGTIVGLGLSPKLLDEVQASDPQKNLYDLIGLPRAFAASLFVGHDDVVLLAKNAQIVVAHELGHALGLQHVTDADNLMYPKANAACQPVLTQAQLASLDGLEKVGAMVVHDDAIEPEVLPLERVVNAAMDLVLRR